MLGGMSPSQLKFRPAVDVDYEAVAVLWRRAWASANPDVPKLEPDQHWLTRAHAEFSSPNRTVLILLRDSVIGFYVTQPDRGLLDQLHIEPSHQGLGIGSYALEHVKADHPRGFALYVSCSNVRAIRFYERAGLQLGGRSVNPHTGRPRIKFLWPGKAESAV